MNNEIPKEKKISVKRILITILILFLLLTTLSFGYLYYSQNQDIENTDYVEEEKTEDGSSMEDNDDVACDFDENIKQASDEANHLPYEYMLEPNPKPTSPYAACKETLKSKIKKILQESETLDNDSIELLSEQIDNGNIAYLIGDDFIVYSIGKIWKVDIVEQTVDLIWETRSPVFVEVQDLYVINENNISRMFFSAGTSGLGGAGDDQESLDELVENMCDFGDLGIFMYDTSTEEFTKIAVAEDCM